ncbi:MAG: ATP-binding cassette domain-containing protein [Synergistetes bacterium]|nr:ATP-binding cassette domain-containing protein [Synergistota bacterium]MCX8127429.1 ATP-binding cassette domain-containing protein [Synergistota bacterium]MDW8192293.1 ATP-binding cassette domain-containing protein [Synergistota bacterium]
MNYIIELVNVKKYFPVQKGIFRRIIGWVKAVDGVSFAVKKGEVFGLVGESGCGKTTLGLVSIGLFPFDGGEVFIYNGSGKRSLSHLSDSEKRDLRRVVQVIFQDPYSSLNPRFKVKDIIAEGLLIHGIAKSKKEAYDIVAEILEKVGLGKECLDRYPHEFSGGQRQRIAIARALALRPSFILCDEPLSALDVSVRAQVLNLLKDLQEELGLSYLFISHDLSVVKYISDRIGVMYLGKLLEEAPRDELFKNPLHPYTKALLASIPVPNPRMRGKRVILKGDPSNPINPPPGCRFHPRCAIAAEICVEVEPELRDLGGRRVACHRV